MKPVEEKSVLDKIKQFLTIEPVDRTPEIIREIKYLVKVKYR